MKENQTSFEQMRATIKNMHTELEYLENALNEGAFVTDEKWTFPEGNYTVLAIWLLYAPQAKRMFAVNKKKSWAELAEKLTKYVGWAVEWHSLRRNYTRKNIKKAR